MAENDFYDSDGWMSSDLEFDGEERTPPEAQDDELIVDEQDENDNDIGGHRRLTVCLDCQLVMVQPDLPENVGEEEEAGPSVLEVQQPLPELNWKKKLLKRWQTDEH